MNLSEPSAPGVVGGLLALVLARELAVGVMRAEAGRQG